MSTSIAGYAELSTRADELAADDALPPISHSRVATTDHVDRRALAGTRPTTSRSKSSTISGRRSLHHASAVVTFAPFFSVSGSGRIGYGFASASS